MFEAQYLFSGGTVLGPWMSRQADNMIMHLDLVKSSSTASTDLKVEIITKNSETAGDPTTPLTDKIDTSFEAVTSKEIKGEVLELLRYKFTASGTADDDYVLFRMLPITWFDTV